MASRYQAKKLTTPQPDGEVRESQVVTPYGPGAMVDLIDHAVLIGGLDFWSYDGRRKRGEGHLAARVSTQHAGLTPEVTRAPRTIPQTAPWRAHRQTYGNTNLASSVPPA